VSKVEVGFRVVSAIKGMYNIFLIMPKVNLVLVVLIR